ncbi:MAG: hypothetical protein QM602_04595 [Microbacterium sp.]
MTLDTLRAQDVLEVLDPTADKLGSTHTPLAPRLDTFDGKVLGLLSNSKPNAENALYAAANKIKERYPTLEIRLYPGSIRFEADLLRQAIEESDALIGCSADCGACTSWLIHDGAQAEKGGKPQVTIVARGFEHDAETSAKVFGVPDLQYVVVPRVFTALTKEQAEAQVEPLVDEIIRLLTTDPAGDRVFAGIDADAQAEKADAYTFEGDLVEVIDEFNDFFVEREFGDGLPLYPATREKVDALVAALGKPADELLLTIPPAHGHGTVEKLAINAALAGVQPDEFPVVIAGLRAIQKCPPPMNLSVLMSTGAFAPVLMVNGPIAKRLGINDGRDPLGPGSKNRVGNRIGRAIGLSLRNLGYWIPGRMDLDTIGTARKFIQVFGENEDESPWEPFHVTRGYRPDESTITVWHSVGEWDLGSNHGPSDVRIRSLASRTPTVTQVGHMTSILGGLQGNEDGVIYLLPPETAKIFTEAGLSKDAVKRFLLHNVRPRISDVIQPLRDFRARGLLRPEWEWVFELTPEEQRTQSIQAFFDPDAVQIVVAGSGTPKDFVFGTMTVPITEKI